MREPELRGDIARRPCLYYRIRAAQAGVTLPEAEVCPFLFIAPKSAVEFLNVIKLKQLL